ncbi:hypothetical protein HD806DRAFT_542841 [Xylariaceae sp. AK1471]|nr:hypothetical protein HD806DRAFT_542841 [Xylariaceae sp. AK1471]
MAPSTETFRKIAEQAERDLNTYEAKTGAHKTSPSDEAGVDTRVENKFPGSQVKYGEDLSTNAGYNKRIPPDEGGDLDSHGRQTRGKHFEGVGGPEHKVAQQARDYGGHNKLDSTGKRQHDIGSKSATDPTVPYRKDEVMAEGKEAVQSNMESAKYVPHKTRYKRGDSPTDESVPAKMSAEGFEPPPSVTEASRESAAYQ